LDKHTKKRMLDKLEAISDAPLDVRLSQPLKGHDKRKTRVGDYRILFEITPTDLIVADIGPRGQIYRTL
jgi:mRNA-degrading endonuclease RelE of RelBE toxin-antitoxin system